MFDTGQSRVPVGDGQNLRGEIYGRLRQDIVTLRRPPGSPMSDKEISVELNVSRTPVREAILRLLDEGLVTVVSSSGTYVAKIHAAALADAQFVRVAIERAAAIAAATAATPADIADLRKIASMQAAAAASSRSSFYQLDETFHQRVFAISGHQEAWNIILRSKTQLDRVRYLSIDNENRLTHVLTEHAAVIDAIEQGDPALSEAAMLRHLSATYANVTRVLDVYRHYFAPDEPSTSAAPPKRARRTVKRAS